MEDKTNAAMPGPWMPGFDEMGAHVYCADGVLIPHIYGNSVEQRHATARLISIAPEMLRILVDTYYRLADIHNEWPGRDSLAGQKRLCDMRDCIAKALGMESKDVYEGEAMRMGVAP